MARLRFGDDTAEALAPLLADADQTRLERIGELIAQSTDGPTLLATVQAL
jgi:hypothetical protein